MSARLESALRAVQYVASRTDPTVAVPVGAIATELSIGLSSASRLCAALAEIGLLGRSAEYGTYRLGPAAIMLSGAAAAPVASAVRLELTRAALHTGETVCLAAPSGASGALGGSGAAAVPGVSDATMRMIAVIDSAWTLHAPAAVGEVVCEPDGALVSAARGRIGDRLRDGGCVESVAGGQVEVAAPVLDPAGTCVATVAIRMPVYRRARGVPLARRAVRTASRRLERALATAEHEAAEHATAEHATAEHATAELATAEHATAELATAASTAAGTPPVESVPRPRSTIETAVQMLTHLATGPDSVPGIATALGLRPDRVRRLIESCRRTGWVQDAGSGRVRLAWAVHGWHRAALTPTLITDGSPLVARVGAQTGLCAYLTVLKGMRSYTLVEHLEELGGGLHMRSWLGRLHPIVGSDGGPTMLMDLQLDQLADIFPTQFSVSDRRQFLDRVQQVTRDGVLVIESIDELGITSVSAPVRDASGTVAAAACLVGATEVIRPRRAAVEAAARRLAAEVSVAVESGAVEARHRPAPDNSGPSVVLSSVPDRTWSATLPLPDHMSRTALEG